MSLISYQVFSNNTARLDFKNGSICVQLDQDSGRILTRNKVGTFKSIQHTGIYLGKRFGDGMPLVIHNHYHYGSAYISTLKEYKSKEVARWQAGTCTNNPITVIKSGLNQVLQGKSYRPITYNCQVTTNIACHNRKDSEDVKKWAGGIFGALIVAALVKGAMAA